MVKINLLPPEVRPPQPLPFFRDRRKIAVSLAGLVTAIYCLFAAHGLLILRRLENVKAQMKLYQPQEKEALKVQQRIEDLRRQKAELENLVQQRRRWSDVLAALDSALPREAWMTKLEVTPNGEIIFTGRTYTLAAVAGCLEALRSLTFLQDVRLQSVQAAPEDKAVLEFSIRSLLREPPE